MAQSVASEAKLIARHSVVYGLSNVLDRVVGFIMLPVYTRFLTPADYGVMELIYMTTSIISLVIGLGVEAAVSRFYFDYSEEPQRKKVISTGVIGYGVVVMLAILALLPFSRAMAGAILDSPDYVSYFNIALLTLGVSIILPIVYAYMRVRQKSVQYMVSKVALTAVNLSLNIYFVVVAQKGVYGILLSNLLAQVLFMVILVAVTLKQTGLGVDFRLLKEMLKFGLPLIPSNISAFIVQASDRYFIKQYAGVSLTGIYSLGYKFGTLVNQFVTSPFIQIWNPRRFEYFGKEGYERIYARIFTYFCILSLYAGLLISLLSREVIRVMAAEPFWPAYKVVPIVVLGYIAFSFHYHFNVGIMMKKQTRYIAYVNVANGVLNLALNFLLIPKFNIWGAAVATLICFAFKAAMTYYFSNRLFKIVMEWRRVITLFFVAFIVFLAGFFIDSGRIWSDILIKGAIGFSYPFVLYLIGFFTDEEIKRAKEFAKQRKLNFK